MIRAVLDTNVLASAVRGAREPSSAPGELYRRCHRNEFQLVLSDHVLDELKEVFDEPYFARRLTKRLISQSLWSFRNLGELVQVADHVARIASHAEDGPVLATAISGRADYRVTGDYELRRIESYRGVAIVNPREFLAVLEQRQPSPGE